MSAQAGQGTAQPAPEVAAPAQSETVAVQADAVASDKAPAATGSLLSALAEEDVAQGGEGDVEQGDAEAPAYVDFALPEDFAIAEDSMTEFKNLAGSLGVPQEKAQQLIDMGVKAVKDSNLATMSKYGELREGWRSEIRQDPQVGGAKLKESIGRAQRALQTFASGAALLQHAEQTGLSDHPDFFRFLVDVDKKVNEGRLVTGGNAPAAPKTDAQVLFPGVK